MRPSLDSYAHLAGGKVRDLYTIDDEHLLLVASDRISAYDHVLSTPIPDKGRVLTAMSVFFFGVLGGNNHLAGEPDDSRIPEEVLGRALVVRKLNMVPVECVARGYLTGSGCSTTTRPARCAASHCPRACGGEPAARPDLHARQQGGAAASTTRTSASRPWSTRWARTWP